MNRIETTTFLTDVLWDLEDPEKQSRITKETWTAVFECPEIARVTREMLWVPSPKPDSTQFPVLEKVLGFVLKGAPPPQHYHPGEIVETEAEVISFEETAFDSEGPTFLIGYRFPTETHPGETKVSIEVGYDLFHASLAGWSEDELRNYWQVGQRIRCRYLRAHPDRHAIAMP